jgi:hypothetical protein
MGLGDGKSWLVIRMIIRGSQPSIPWTEVPECRTRAWHASEDRLLGVRLSSSDKEEEDVNSEAEQRSVGECK